jgi:CRP-like cAMP-binding protein
MGEVTYETGKTIIKQGDPGDIFYVLVSGTCNVVIQNSSGDESVVAQLGPNDFFGERALLTSEPRAATIIAMTNVSLLEVCLSFLAYFFCLSHILCRLYLLSPSACRLVVADSKRCWDSSQPSSK